VSKYTPKEIAKGLELALSLMNDGGKHWIKGAWRKKNMKGELCFCTNGGINEAARRMGLPPSFAEAMKRELVRHGLGKRVGYYERTPSDQIMDWNDTGSTRWGDVRKAFTRGIKALGG